MRGVILAWGLGMGIIVYRSVVKEKRPPVPGQMLAATGLFALLAALAEYQPAATAATAFAFGVDIAVLMQVLPGTSATTAAAKTTTAAPAATVKAV
jgi:hypothetical protein